MAGRERPPLWVGLCAGLMLVGLGVGCLLLFGNRTVHPMSTELTTGRVQEPDLIATGPSTAAPRPRHAAAKFRCFDGTVVQAPHRCQLNSRAAQYYAFGLQPGQCRAGRPSSHARWSSECRVRGVDVHLATYEPGTRSERLATYGPRQDLGNGRIAAGGPKTAAGRWLRTYDDAAAHAGLLMYASVGADDPYNRQVLMSLAQRFSGYLLQGQPVAAG